MACQPQTEDHSVEEEIPAYEYKIPDIDSSLMRFEATIKDFERDDSTNLPGPGGLVFAGSSSFRRWNSLEEDMSPIPVVNRGFGGSTFPELNYYAHRIIAPLQPSLIAVYEGDNDIVDSTMTPAMVLENLKKFEAFTESQIPQAHILMFAVKPSPSRRHLLDKAIETNRLLAEYATQSERITYVDVFTIMMNDHGSIKSEIFTDDSLHMNADGYALWTAVAKPVVDALFQAGQAK